jgi:hypothetical protein
MLVFRGKKIVHITVRDFKKKTVKKFNTLNEQCNYINNNEKA